MVSWRELESVEQVSRREQNESTARGRAAASGEIAEASFRCECGDRSCSCAISLTLAEYEVVRACATHFAVARNHENPECQRVIQENAGFAVVETVTGEATKLARRTDPRQRRRESCWRESLESRKQRRGR